MSDRNFKDAVKMRSATRLHLDEMALNRWSVSNGQVSYCKPDTHTLSIYLSGGVKSFRKDQKSNKGGREKICVMPQDHLSQWEINDEIDFLHFYFSDEAYKRHAEVNFDLDIRSYELKEMVYDHNPLISNLLIKCAQVFEKDSGYSLIEKEHFLLKLMDQIVLCCSSRKINLGKIKGGLSSKNIKCVREAVFDKIESQLTLESLATEIHLSPYHFAKMFKISFGETPAQYILNCRLKVAKQLLATDKPLSEIGLLSGFSHQSHMTSVFKKRIGLTPNQYRHIY